MLGWELPPYFAGGMGTVCYNLCQFLARSGADIEFILPFEADYSDIDFMRVNPGPAPESAPIRYKDLRNVHATTYGKVDISESEAHALNIRSFEEIHGAYLDKVTRLSILGSYDVVHAHDWLTMRAGIIAKQLTGSPLIVHIHATEFDRAGASGGDRGNEMIHTIEYEGMMAADKVIAVSQFTKNLIMERYKIPAERIAVVHNGIDLASPYLHANGHARDQYAGLKKLQWFGYKVVVNVSRHTVQKGLMQLLDTAKLVVERRPKTLFLLIGDGELHHELMERAAEMGLSKNVIFAGFQSGVRARDAYRMADAFLMTSQSEPFGTTALEAMGFGTPVIVSKQSGVSEKIRTAFKADFWDTRVMADRVLSVLNHESLHATMAAAGEQELDDLSYATTASGTLAVYRDSVGVLA